MAGEARRDLRLFNFQCVRMPCVCVVLCCVCVCVEEPWCNAKLSWSDARAHLPGCYQELNYSVKLLPLRLSPPLPRLFSPLPAPSSFKRCICARLTLFPRSRPLTFVALSCRFGRKCPPVLLFFFSRRQEKRGASPNEPRWLQQK